MFVPVNVRSGTVFGRCPVSGVGGGGGGETTSMADIVHIIMILRGVN